MDLGLTGRRIVVPETREIEVLAGMLERHGASVLREGGRHSYWGFDPERSTAVPRHREIGWPLSQRSGRSATAHL